MQSSKSHEWQLASSTLTFHVAIIFAGPDHRRFNLQAKAFNYFRNISKWFVGLHALTFFVAALHAQKMDKHDKETLIIQLWMQFLNAA